MSTVQPAPSRTPEGGERYPESRWTVLRFALEDWSTTARLAVLVILVLAVSVVTKVWLL